MTHRKRAGLPWLTLVAGLLLASCSEVLSTDGSDIDHITVSPTSVALTAGEARTITAQAFDGDGQRLVGRQLFWSTQNASVATVSQSGVITGVASGNTQVAASAGGKSALVAVSVNARPVTLVRVTPSPASVQAGRTVTLVAEALDASGAGVPGRQVDWSTSNASVATVSAAGVVTGVATGSATITATVDGIRGTSVVSVTAVPAATVSVTPNSGSIVQGGALQLTATVRDAQGNTLAGRPVTWSSSNESVASVSSSGRVVGIAEGSFTITARSDAASGTGAYTVTRIPVGRVTLSPSTVSIAVGQAQPLTVSLFAADQVTPLPLAGRVIAWTSSNPSVATVSGSGSVTGVSTGSATITAAVEGKSGTSTVSVTAVPIASIAIAPGNVSVEEGTSTTLVATARDANNNVLPGRTFFWSSSNAAQFSVTTAGLVAAVVGSAGASATISASAPGGGVGGSTPSASATVTASWAPVASMTLLPPSQSIEVGKSTSFNLSLRTSGGQALPTSGRTVTWKSLNPAIATANATTGAVTGVAQGGPITIEVSANSPGQGTPVKATASVTVSNVPVASVIVTPHTSPVYVGYTRTFSVVTKDANGNTLSGRPVQWASLDNNKATVNALTGDVLGVATGPVIIRATSEGVSGDANINVGLVPIASVVVTPSLATLDLTTGQKQQLAASPRDGAGAQVTGTALGLRTTTWTSDATGVATVTSTGGLVTPVGVGTATITAKIDAASGTSTVTVTQSVGSVQFTATTDSLILPGGSVNGTVTVLDGATPAQPLSGRTVTLTSAPAGVVSIAPSSGTTDALGMLPVVISGAAPGNATITATSGTKSANVAMRVLPGMTSISLAPADDSLFVGGSIAFTATALAGSTPLADRRLAIQSTVTTVATVAPAIANTGAAGTVPFVMTAVSPGTTLLSVSSATEGQNVSRTMKVLAPAATVSVSSSIVPFFQDSTQTFTAVVLDAASVQLVGRPKAWSSSNVSKLTIDPTTGAAIALDSGTVTISATVANGPGTADDVTGSTLVTISLEQVATVGITPSTVNVPQGGKTALTINARIAGGAAARGRSCSAVSSLPSTASVDPPGLGTTDQNGDLAITVTGGLSSGSTTITATCEGIPGTATVTVP